MKKMKALSFGEILFDVIEGDYFLGGAPLNFAAHVAKCGAESFIFSRVGNDNLGREACQQIENIDVGLNFIQKDMVHPTGTVAVKLFKGQPDYTIREDVAYDYIDYTEAEKHLVEHDFDVLYYGTLAQRSSISKRSLYELLESKKFKHIFYDINLRKGCYSLEILQESLRHCTILKLNDEEVDVLSTMFLGIENSDITDFAAMIAKEFSINLIVITAGAKGCYIYENGIMKFAKGFPVTVIDTVGAGDSFSAAFITQYFKHGDSLEAAKTANRLGAFVASCRGPIPTYSREIRRLME